MNGIYCKWPSLYCVWSPPLPLYDRTQRCQISFIMTLLFVCWHLTKTIRWGWFRFFFFTWTLKAWAGHPMITQIFSKLNQLNIWNFYKLFFMTPILPKNPKKFRCYSVMGSNTCQKKSNFDPNKNKLFLCGVIKLLIGHMRS